MVGFPNSDAKIIYSRILREALDCFCKCSSEETNMQSHFQQPNGNHLYNLPIPQIKLVQRWAHHLHSLTVLICMLLISLVDTITQAQKSIFFLFKYSLYEASHLLSHFSSTLFFYLFSSVFPQTPLSLPFIECWLSKWSLNFLFQHISLIE